MSTGAVSVDSGAVETASVSISHIGELEISVSSVPEDCVCNICTKVLTSPHLTECCGQHCCANCLQQWVSTSFNTTGMCPFCREENVVHIQDKKMERKIKDLEACCPHQDEGCDWRGPLGDIRTVHLSMGCKYTMVECPQGCGDVIKRHSLKEHVESTCQLRRVECKFCHEEGTADSIKEHLSVCPEFPLLCTSGCEESVARKSMQMHLQRECPLSHSTSLHPRDTTEHRPKAREDHRLMTLHQLSSEVQSLKARVDSLQQENKSLREDVSDMADRLVAAEEELCQSKTWEETAGNVLARELSFLQPYRPTNASVVAIECIRTRLSKRLLQLSSTGPPLVFRLAPYSKFKSSGRVWHTPPFYVDQGYKMYLAVHLDGIGTGKFTHISLCVHQLAGEYDSLLAWPFWFDCELIITLMRQDNHPRLELMNRGSGGDKYPSKHHFLSTFHHPESPQIFRRRSATPKEAPNEAKTKSKSHTLPKGFDVDELSSFAVQDILQRHLPDPLLGHSQEMSVGTWLRQVKGECLPYGPICCKLELFCTQSLSKALVHQDSLVFRIEVSYRDNRVKEIGALLNRRRRASST